MSAKTIMKLEAIGYARSLVPETSLFIDLGPDGSNVLLKDRDGFEIVAPRENPAVLMDLYCKKVRVTITVEEVQ